MSKRKRFKAFTIDHMDSIQLLVCYQSLHMAHHHKTYLAHPSLVRHTTKVWLGKVGIETSPTARWGTLLRLFCDAYRPLLPIDKDNNPLPPESKQV